MPQNKSQTTFYTQDILFTTYGHLKIAMPISPLIEYRDLWHQYAFLHDCFLQGCTRLYNVF